MVISKASRGSLPAILLGSCIDGHGRSRLDTETGCPLTVTGTAAGLALVVEPLIFGSRLESVEGTYLVSTTPIGFLPT